MKKTILRKNIIKALKTEPLGYGHWLSDAYSALGNRKKISDFDKLPEGCTVCAVGATLRKELHVGRDKFNRACSLNTHHYHDAIFEDAKKEIKEQLGMGNFLGALSIFFEAQGDIVRRRKGMYYEDQYPNVTPAVRHKLVEFVKKNFPVSITVKV